MLDLAAILVLGIFAQWLAWRVKLPAILPLIIFGLLVGPLSTFLTPDGSKLIDGDEIFTGHLLFSFVSLSVGIILFEGGLTLKLNEIKNQATTVRNLLTIGALITAIGGTLTAYYLLEMDLKIAILFGALIIVSGPTVISPILRNVRPNQKINTILKWEGILIDPLGALVAVLAYEFIKSSKPGEEFTLMALKEFFLTISSGFFMGFIGAFILYYMIKNNRVPPFLRNVVTLALVVLTFAFSEFLQRESGLMAATVMGIILANIKMEEIKNILSFKEDVSIILISALFILLSSRIEIQELNQLGIESLWLFLIIILLIRPLSVLVSTWGSDLNWRERTFIAWIGPKGIVAAAIASLFSIELVNRGGSSELVADSALLVPLVFMIITGTVIIQGSTAKWVARLLKVDITQPTGILFVGANEVSRFIAKYLKEQGVPVLLTDTARSNIQEAQSIGLPVFEGSIFSEKTIEELDLSNIGQMFALTSNSEVNSLACQRFKKELGEENVYRLVSRRELELKDSEKPPNLLFSGQRDFINLIQKIRKKPVFKTKKVNNEGECKDFLKSYADHSIPLFIKSKDQKYHVINSYLNHISKGDELIYLEDKDIKPQESSSTKPEA